MNNKYIDNKLQEFDKLWPNLYTVVPGLGQGDATRQVKQFIKEALEQVEHNTRLQEQNKQIYQFWWCEVHDTSHGAIKLYECKLKSEQEVCNCLCHGMGKFKNTGDGISYKTNLCTHCQKPEEQP